ncbi:MAG TPA: hypothetical protein VHE36_05095 [Sphingomicrobium sp.]|jgi:hypothetical protein|nr:hypothetical protein [Sphingomicrobium sp.]
MTRTIILTLAGAAVAASAAMPAEAQYGRWNERGWRTVAYRQVNGRDTDIIRMRGHIRERRIRVCAINQPLRLRDFDIRFQNGGHQDVRTRAVLRAGTCTRAVDLRGNRRDINAVRLRYEPIYRSALRPYVRIQVR